jgi:hypothetical protein
LIDVDPWSRGVRVVNPILQDLVAFPGREVHSPGDAHEDATREAERSRQRTIWRRAIVGQAQSDLLIQTYCQRKSLNPRSFRAWRQELACRNSEVASTRPSQCPASSPKLAGDSEFLPVRVVQDTGEPVSETQPIEILLPAGPTIRVTKGFDPHALDAIHLKRTRSIDEYTNK